MGFSEIEEEIERILVITRFETARIEMKIEEIVRVAL